MIVLDTNVISEAGKPTPDPGVVRWLGEQAPAELYLCGPVLMEQYFGAELLHARTGSDRYLRIIRDGIVPRFAGRILEFDRGAPEMAGRVRAMRERAGRPISVVDAMIAAICLVNGAALATRNVRDFAQVDLRLVNPFEVA
jgi:toxin FitB